VSFVQRIIKARSNTICLIIAPVAGAQTAWYFIRVEPTKFGKFQKEVFQHGVNLGEYGEILKRGYGDYPPQSVIEEMVEAHGFDPEN